MALPLENIVVLDLTRLLPGPYCTQVLADFGATVIKVEEPTVGDYVRAEPEQVDEAGSALFHSLNRNKKSVTLNLKDEADKTLFKKLVETADVVVESFRPGVMARLGLDYESLRAINDRLIYCAITGYGQTGPYKALAGHDSNYLSYAGVLQLQGRSEQLPVLSSVQIADLAGGAQQATTGILLALIERASSGKGQLVDIAMLDGSVALLQTSLANYLVNGQEPKRSELYLSGGLACYDIYETKDHRYVSVAALEMKFWQPFCEVIGEPDFVKQLDAPQHIQHEMRERIRIIFKQKSLADWLALFEGVDTCVAPLLTFGEMIEHPQIQAREIIVDVELEHQTIKQIGIPIKLSRTPGTIRTAAPKLGQHNDELLTNKTTIR